MSLSVQALNMMLGQFFFPGVLTIEAARFVCTALLLIINIGFFVWMLWVGFMLHKRKKLGKETVRTKTVDHSKYRVWFCCGRSGTAAEDEEVVDLGTMHVEPAHSASLVKVVPLDQSMSQHGPTPHNEPQTRWDDKEASGAATSASAEHKHNLSPASMVHDSDSDSSDGSATRMPLVEGSAGASGRSIHASGRTLQM
jgi:hypothetical protein